MTVCGLYRALIVAVYASTVNNGLWDILKYCYSLTANDVMRGLRQRVVQPHNYKYAVSKIRSGFPSEVIYHARVI